MYTLNLEDYERYKGPLFHHFGQSDDPQTSKNIDGPAIGRRKFIDSYFRRFIKTVGETNDNYDPSRVQFDDYGIPQDLGKVNFVITQKEHHDYPSNLGHIPVWMIRHFEYSVRLFHDFVNTQKFKKIKEIRKTQKNLPIAERKSEIVEMLKTSQVLIIAGDTGCGKSTQVPQYLLEAGYTGVACTQPRRIACTALAKRVSYETLNTYGSDVAYQIRFETTKSKRTRLLFLTEGLLLRQMEGDPLLQQYNVIILDEVHERHLTSDLLIGLLKDLISKRDDIKVILMSATINLELFTGYFEGAPVIQVPGRLFPIQLKWHPIKLLLSDGAKKDNKIDPEPFLRILELIDKETPATQRGDVLIFLNGIAEMNTIAETLKTYAQTTNAWIILMLHSGLSTEEQDKVFDIAPQGIRKCILSTNIAETSVTIDGIRFVIDSGKVNLIKHEAGTETRNLEEFWVSKASANQRKGRAGRTGPGICYRLYSQEQYEKMEDFTPSEINRVSLQEMVLKIVGLNLGLDPRTFPFIEKPSEEALLGAIENLKNQSVLRLHGNNIQLTALGTTLSKLPVDVSIGKMLVLGCVVNQLEVMLTVAAGLSLQSPFTNRSFRDMNIIEKRASLTSPMGDHFTLIAVFREWVMQKTFHGSSRKWTIENGIDEHRMYEISKLRNQYRKILEEAGLAPKTVDPDAEDSRLRRIDQGEKKKLMEMKNAQRNEVRSRKVLSSRKHYDTILEDKEEEDIEAEMDPLKADVKTVEFLLGHKQKEVDKIRTSHKLRRSDAKLIRVVIAIALYPNYSALDMANKYRAGQEIFVHTRMKPFTLLHPNSAIAQYHLESIDPRTDHEGRSIAHQLLLYSLLLKTKKPYICNVMPIPILYATLFAKKVECKEDTTIVCDDFVEVKMNNEQEREDIIQQALDFRKELAKGMVRKLLGEDFNSRRLKSILNGISTDLVERGKDVGLKRNVMPPEILSDPGVHLADGTVENEDDIDEMIQKSNAMEAMEEEGEEDLKDFDPMAPVTREALEEEEDRKKEKVEEKKESYYEKLLKRQRQKELEEGEKKPKMELDDVE